MKRELRRRATLVDLRQADTGAVNSGIHVQSPAPTRYFTCVSSLVVVVRTVKPLAHMSGVTYPPWRGIMEHLSTF